MAQNRKFPGFHEGESRLPVPNDPQNLPDRWCFGLAHPYMQRLIYLAGLHEQSESQQDISNAIENDKKAVPIKTSR